MLPTRVYLLSLNQERARHAAASTCSIATAMTNQSFSASCASNDTTLGGNHEPEEYIAFDRRLRTLAHGRIGARTDARGASRRKPPALREVSEGDRQSARTERSEGELFGRGRGGGR